ncbi:MAG: beta-glucosidase [Bacteroidetes bacterium]|nr:beta-glucosidase [Bacteroidota bacterium]
MSKITYFLLFVIVSIHVNAQKLPYQDKKIPIEKRVEDLVSRMTIAEKARQLDMYSGSEVIANGTLDKEKAKKAIGELGIGSIHDFYPASGKSANSVQKFVIESSRLGIPAIIIEEGLHGYSGIKATAFPVSIGIGSTWNPELIYKMGRAIGTEARSKGVHMLLSPVLGIAREPRWGRTEETYGEDPYLASQIGLSFVRGLQGNNLSDQDAVASEPKHYGVHSSPASGRNQATVPVGEREARTSFLSVFETAVKEGNAQGIMAAYHDLDGVPCSSNSWLLSEVLRDEWGFEGFVLSDLGAIRRQYKTLKTVETEKAAIINSLIAGLDMQFYDFSHEIFQQSIIEAVQDGELDEEYVNKAVKNVLRVKFKLGLFDTPFVDENLDKKVYHCKEHQKLVTKVGRESIVLLKNENQVLPLAKDKIKSIAVLGDLANKELLGGYSPKEVEVISVLEGIKRKVGDNIVIKHSKGIALNQLFANIDPENLYTTDKKTHGINAEFFNNMELTGNPDVVNVEKDFIFEWHNRCPQPGINDFFSARFTGFLKPDIDGKYRLRIGSNDRLRYHFNGKLIFDNWEETSKKSEPFTVELQAGKLYPIKIEYSKKQEFARIGVHWALMSKSESAENDMLNEAVEMAKSSDVAIVVIGENANEVGEGKDKMNLDLEPAELELIQEVHKTGTPLVLVLFNGRPLSINWAAENIPAILEAWYPGENGGDAVADIIFGDYNPSGRLPISIPKSVGQLPIYYNQKPFNKMERGYVDGDSYPLYPFGHGLSYTTFQYSKLRLSKKQIKKEENVTISVDVTNTGKVKGTDIVQLYINDIVSSMVTPLIELKGFEKLELAPAETRTIKFTLGPKELSLWNGEMEKLVEPGKFSIMIGKSSKNIVLQETLEVVE